MPHATLCLIWFGLLGILLAVYAILDGFDLGVGMVHPFIARGDRERRIVMNSIGPIWDGNEVWLVTFGGALFAMFPMAYATVFSAFYVPFMLLLLALILRAVSLEFRSKITAPRWRSVWDGAFFAGSGLAALLFGVAIGNAILGIPLDARGDFRGTLLDLLHPYALLVGALSVSMLCLHGLLFLQMKTRAELQARCARAVWPAFGIFLVLYIIATMVTTAALPSAVENFRHHPWLWAVPVLNVLAVANIPRALHLGRPAQAFASSAAAIAALVFLVGAATFPNLVRSDPFPGHSLSLFDAASSAKTLRIGLVIVAIGLPAVIAYSVIIYRTFRGPVELDAHSY
jgi:cytochrome d ubiquinol oxidase subunit II